MSGSDDMNFSPYDDPTEYGFNPEYAEAPPQHNHDARFGPISTASDWERGESIPPKQEEPAETDRPFWEMGPNHLVELPAPQRVWIVMEEGDYESGDDVIAVFNNEGEAKSYAALRNEYHRYNERFYVDDMPIGRPGIDSDEPYFDGMAWFVNWSLMYDTPTTHAEKLIKSEWLSGTVIPKEVEVISDQARFNNNKTFTIRGTDRDKVIELADKMIGERVAQHLQELQIAAQKRAEGIRFRIDSKHEFG